MRLVDLGQPVKVKVTAMRLKRDGRLTFDLDLKT